MAKETKDPTKGNIDEDTVIEVAASAAAVAANRVFEEYRNPDPFDNPFANPSPKTFLSLYDVDKRPDSPIKEAIFSQVRENAKHPDDDNLYNNNRINVSAKWDGDDVKVAIGRPIEDRGGPCRPVRDMFQQQHQVQQARETPDVEVFRVSRDEAKSFFGKAPVRLAQETGKVINRVICDGDL